MPSKTVTQVSASPNHIYRITIDVAETGIECFVTYKSFDSNGAQIGNHKVLTMVLAQGQKDMLTAFVQKDVVDAVNAAEGT